MHDKNDDFVEVDVTITHETAKAFKVTTDGVDEIWLPKSQLGSQGTITRDSSEGDNGTVILPSWLAIEKGFV